MNTIVLSTLNARYVHASMGLRCLAANMGDLRAQTLLAEFVIGQKTEDIVEQLLALSPRVIGFGVYIWNVLETTRIVAQLKLLAPEICIVLGGPEVSYETEQQAICGYADYVITGWGDHSFPQLVSQILNLQAPVNKIVVGIQPPLASLKMPYREYSDADLKHRYLYVEASRGCPFKCEFCLSALDASAWPFPLDAFLAELDELYKRGARQFKFVDRTFNLKIDTSLAILNFFLTKLEAAPADAPFLHFELIPDHLPERLKELLPRFPPGTLQFELGIQTFNVEVQQRISRRQKNAVAEANIAWLRSNTHAHLHVDLIAGLPGESLDSFGAGFNRLYALNPHEIQFGILKRLRGTPIARHSLAFAMRYSPEAPYTILANSELDFFTLQRLSRFARYWDLIGNSGRFKRSLPLLLGEHAFAAFLEFSDWLFQQSGQTHGIAHERLVNLLHRYFVDVRAAQAEHASATLIADYVESGARSKLDFVDVSKLLRAPRERQAGATPQRQARHLLET